MFPIPATYISIIYDDLPNENTQRETQITMAQTSPVLEG